MKKKFLILTLCFTLIFSSINYEKSYADGGIISLPILATVTSLAVASGVVIKGNDDLYDIGLAFYNYVKEHNDLTWDIIETAFSTGVVLLNNKLVSVDSNFLDIVKGFFDNLFSSSSSNIVISGKHIFPNYVPIAPGDYKLFKLVLRSNYYYLQILLNNGSYYELPNWRLYYKDSYIGIGFAPVDGYPDKLKVCYFNNDGSSSYNQWSAPGHVLFDGGIVSIPYQGGYSWDNVESKKENDSISLPIPGNLGQLVGQGSTDFWDNTDNLIGTGGVTIPGVNDPSIGVDDSISFPLAPSVPDEGIWSNITEYIVGLVVPSDAFWTDSFGGLHNNFINSFPMVDMSEFNSLSVNGKPFPNIDVDIMGSSGRVVNGDTVNSIVDWLRPIISGFIFLCLMFFNYRKLYKLIRNSEPFEGIGKVENHAN